MLRNTKHWWQYWKLNIKHSTEHQYRIAAQEESLLDGRTLTLTLRHEWWSFSHSVIWSNDVTLYIIRSARLCLLDYCARLQFRKGNLGSNFTEMCNLRMTLGFVQFSRLNCVYQSDTQLLTACKTHFSKFWKQCSWQHGCHHQITSKGFLLPYIIPPLFSRTWRPTKPIFGKGELISSWNVECEANFCFLQSLSWNASSKAKEGDYRKGKTFFQLQPHRFQSSCLTPAQAIDQGQTRISNKDKAFETRWTQIIPSLNWSGRVRFGNKITHFSFC